MQVFILLAIGALALDALKEDSPILFLVFSATFVGTLWLIFKMEGAL